jgi:S-DNA-T family DNA segregation ATPase FtsK/SpoIIIE
LRFAGSDGPVTVDLAVDGPHAPVAGTTGSESRSYSRRWSPACTVNRPDELAIVLIDQGRQRPPISSLPHTIAVVTDLDGPLLGVRSSHYEPSYPGVSVPPSRGC